jgi:hypothetical protein
MHIIYTGSPDEDFQDYKVRSEQEYNRNGKIYCLDYFIPKPKQQRRKTSYLRSKIWNRHDHKNKASNNVI